VKLATAYSLITDDAEQSRKLRVSDTVKVTEWMRRTAQDAISLDASYSAEVKRSEELLVLNDARGSALALSRATRIHAERCRRIQQTASFARMLMLAAAGDLTITESTAGTGLERDERIAVSEVSGTAE